MKETLFASCNRWKLAGAAYLLGSLITMAASCDPPPSTILGWWRAEGNAQDSVGTNNGTLAGGVTYGVGKVGQAFEFEGNAQAVELGTAPSLQLQSFTVEAWIQRASASMVGAGNPSDVVFFAYGVDGYGFGIRSSGQLLLSQVGVNEVLSSVSITDTNFHHVAVTITNSYVVFYVDGAQYPYSTAYQPNFSFDSVAAIGGSVQSGGISSTFEGAIDELAVYNGALTPAQIQAIYHSGDYGKCTGLGAPTISSGPTNETVLTGNPASFVVVANGAPPLSYQWAFDGTNISGATNFELTLTSAQETNIGSYSVVVSNSYGSVTNNSPAVLEVVASIPCTPAPPTILSWWRAQNNAVDWVGTNNGILEGSVGYGPGVVGQAFVFTGSNGCAVELGADPSLQLQNFTIEGWIRLAKVGTVTLGTGGSAGVILAWGIGGFGFALTPSGELFLTDIGIDQENSGATIADTNFHHVAVTKSGTALAFYLDGVAYPYGSPYTSTFTFSQLGIGARGDNLTGNFYGTIDELAVYSGALTTAQIQTIYSNGVYGKCTGLGTPTISANPTNETVLSGSAASFEVEADGAPPVTYQWAFNGTNLSGATNAQLKLIEVQTNQAGSYSVIVSNIYGSVTSAPPAVLTVTLPTCTPAPPSLVAWWRAEGLADDWIGTNDGTLEGGVTYGPGEAGQAFVFTGSNGCAVELGTAPALQLQNFTIEAWIRLSQAGTVTRGTGNSSGVIFSWGTGGFGFALTSGGELFLSDIGIDQENSGARISDTNFHHVAVTRSGTTLVFYLDGVAYPYGSPYTSTFTFSQAGIGALGDNLTANFYGTIDELAIYNQALTTAQIAAIYNSSSAGKCPGSKTPVVVLPPSTVNAFTGTNLTFTPGADGSAPLSFYWVLDGTNLPGATNSTLVLTNVQFSQAGTYSVVVSNSLGAVTNTNTFLSLTFPPTTIQAVSNSVAGGGTVTVDLNVVANGNESTLQFSLDFPAKVLSYVGSAVGTGAAGSVFQATTANVTNGQLGLYIELPGSTFPAGTQQIVTVTFKAALVTNSTNAALTFGNSPDQEGLSDVSNNSLPAVYASGSVAVAPTVFEGDMSPRTNGNEILNIADWAQEGLFVVGLQTTSNASEFARADCSPRSTGGDGVLNLFDWVQAGRYAAGLGPLTAVGYPPGGGSPAPGGGSARAISFFPITQNAPTNTVTVQATTLGNENSLAFSVTYDPTLLHYVSATLGAGATGATLVVNSTNASTGKLGFLTGYFPPGVFSAGTNQLVNINFASVFYSAAPTLSFANSPVACLIADTNASALAGTFQSGSLAVAGSPWPTLGIAASGTNVVLSWPVSPTPLMIQTLSSAGANWSNSLGAELTNNGNVSLTLPAPTNYGFYRLISE